MWLKCRTKFGAPTASAPVHRRPAAAGAGSLYDRFGFWWQTHAFVCHRCHTKRLLRRTSGEVGRAQLQRERIARWGGPGPLLTAC